MATKGVIATAATMNTVGFQGGIKRNLESLTKFARGLKTTSESAVKFTGVLNTSSEGLDRYSGALSVATTRVLGLDGALNPLGEKLSVTSTLTGRATESNTLFSSSVKVATTDAGLYSTALTGVSTAASKASVKTGAAGTAAEVSGTKMAGAAGAADTMAAAEARAGDAAVVMGNKTATAGKKALIAEGKFKAMFGHIPKYAAIASAAVVVGSLDVAAKFQASMNLLITAGGQPAAKVAQIGKGVQKIAVDTGTSLDQLSEGAYVVAKSFGNEGAAGQLNILRAAAEGAKAENVDLATATDALTSVMKSYGGSGKDATKFQDELVRASGLSKTTMTDFAGSLANVIPLASSLGIGFDQVGGAIATMTQHGETAQRATDNLSNLITNLAGQNNVASQAMQQLGIDTTDLQKNLGKRGLTGTLDVVEKAIAKNSKGGFVVVKAFKQSANATAALKTMLKSMTPEAAKLSEQFQNGQLSFHDYQIAMKDLGGKSYVQANQFKSLYVSSQGFNNALKSGNKDISTTASTLQKALGGVTGMRTALMLGGTSAEGFKDAVKEIGGATKGSGKDIETWKVTQKNATVQLGKLKESIAVVGVQLGTKLLPYLVSGAKYLTTFFTKLTEGDPKTVSFAKNVAIVVGAFAGLFVIQKTVSALLTVSRGIISIGKLVFGLGKILLTGVKWAFFVARAIVSFAIVATKATISAARTATVWIISAARSGTPWVAMRVKAIAAFTATRISAGINALKTGAVWAAQGAKSGAVWTLMKLRAIGAFAATAASAVASGVKMAAIWVAQKAAIGGYILAQGALKVATGVATAAQWLFNVALDANPIGLIVLAVAALVTGLVLFFTKTKLGQQIWAGFTKFLGDAWHTVSTGIVAAAKAVWTGITTAFNAVVGFAKKWGPTLLLVIAPVIGIPLLIISHWAQISAFFTSLWQKVTGAISAGISIAVAAVRGFVTNTINTIVGIKDRVVGFFSSAGQWLFNAGHKIVSGLMGGVKKFIALEILGLSIIKDRVVGFVSGAGQWLFNAGHKVISGLVGGVKNFIALEIKGFNIVRTRVVGFFTGAGKWLYTSGRNVVQGLLSGAGSLLKTVGTFFLNKLPGFIREPFKKALGIHSPSVEFTGYGKNILQGVVLGVKHSKTLDDIKTQMGKVGDLIKKAFDAKKISAATRDSLTGALAIQNKAISKLADARDKITQRIADANQFATDTSGSLVGLGTVTGGGRFLDIRNSLTSLKTNLSAFKSGLTQLAKLGLNKTALSQVISQFTSDPAAGLATVKAILGAGKTGISQVNSIQSGIATTAKSIGILSSNVLNDSIKNTSGKSLVAGLQSQKAALNKQIDSLGRRFAQQISQSINELQAVARKTTKAVKSTSGDGGSTSSKKSKSSDKSETGGDTYNITINADGLVVGTSEAAIGKELAKLLIAYKKSGGKLAF